MRTSLMDFTRGSQVAETIAMMFGAALKPMLFSALAIVLGITAWLLWHNAHPGDGYYWMMHSYAAVWHYFAFNPKHPIGLRMTAGDTVRVPMSMINSYPPLMAAWTRFWSAMGGGLTYGSLIGVPLAILATGAFQRYGARLTKRKHKRGSQLVGIDALVAEIATYNDDVGRSDRDADRRRILGPQAWRKAPFVSRQALIAAGMYEPYTLAGVSYPWRTEQTHSMLVGTTGVGKSTVMKDLLRQIRERGGRAVVFDLTGTYVESFYNQRTDIILNPFDARCPKWSPFSDAHTREHFKEASLALVPIADGGGDSFWPDSARMLFVEVCVNLVRQGRGNNQALYDVLMTSKLKDLHAHVLKTVAAPLTDPEAKRMAESIRATFNTYAQALGCLPTEGRPFSVRDWVLESAGETDESGVHIPAHGSIMFVAAQHVNLRSVRVLLTLWLTTAINTLMSMPGDQQEIRMWFLLDEINALHNIPAIVSGMQTARNYGGAFVLGVHTMHQLKETYGDNLAETIASLAKTKLLMNTRDEGTQKWASAQVGEGEWAEMEENFSYGVSNVRDAATLQRKVKLEPLVIPSQFQELRDLTGYLKFPQGMPAALIGIEYVRYKKPNVGFVEREIEPLAPPEQPILALPSYFVRDGVTVTRDGEILDPSETTKGVRPAVDPADCATESDPTGEGFQAAVATATDPDRASTLDTARPIDWVRNNAEAERLNASLDPRLNPRVLPGEGGAAALLASQRAQREIAASNLVDNQLDTAKADSLAVQEQRQSFGDEEKVRRQAERAAGNNLPEHAVIRDPAGLEPDYSDWGR
jgi:type IV conjugative transfer system coupling protein TraD